MAPDYEMTSPWPDGVKFAASWKPGAGVGRAHRLRPVGSHRHWLHSPLPSGLAYAGLPIMSGGIVGALWNRFLGAIGPE
jgi:hypothetical protein